MITMLRALLMRIATAACMAAVLAFTIRFQPVPMPASIQIVLAAALAVAWAALIAFVSVAAHRLDDGGISQSPADGAAMHARDRDRSRRQRGAAS